MDGRVEDPSEPRLDTQPLENYKDTGISRQEQASADGLSDSVPTRACQSCRLSKVRCNQPSPGMPCARCQKSGKMCIPAEQSVKRQKQSNSRMAELESRIDALATSIMQSYSLRERSDSHTNPSPTASSSPQADVTSRTSQKLLPSALSSPSNRDVNQGMRGSPLSMGPLADQPSPSFNYFESAGNDTIPPSFIDSVISQNLDEITANNIFNRYISGMAPNLPFVMFPADTKASDVRKSTPIVFLSILDIASAGFCEVAVQRNIRKLIVQLYLHYMLRTNEYSLPLLQALIISAAWYQPIEPIQPGEQMDVYQLSHTASNMAIIMGLDKRLGARSWGGPSFVPKQRLKGPHSAIQEKSLAARRVWLGCHYICSNTSMALHAPNVMRWTRYMDECLETLENSPAAFPSDKLFCQHIRLQHIIEEFELQLDWDNVSVAGPTREIQAQVTHRAFKRQLLDWANAVPKDCWNETLHFSRLFATLYINDVVLNSTSRQVQNQDLEVQSGGEQSHKFVIDEPTFFEFLETVNSIFQIVFSLDMAAIRALPTVYFIRIIYVVIILVKLHFAAMQLPGDDGKTHTAELKVGERLDDLIQMFAGWGTLWPANRLTRVLRKLQSWFEKNSSCKMTVHELSWLNSWVFKRGDDTGPEKGGPQPASSIPTPFGDSIPPEALSQVTSPPAPSQAPSQSTADWTLPDDVMNTSTLQDLPNPSPFSNNTFDNIPLSGQPNGAFDFSEPLSSMDLDQIFPGAIGELDMNFNVNTYLEALGSEDFTDGKLGFGSPQVHLNTDMSGSDWSTLLDGDTQFDADGVMKGLEYDKKNAGDT
ncbi:hypothetical protein MferCBS31731_002234 [Microsporum ferrugineum]